MLTRSQKVLVFWSVIVSFFCLTGLAYGSLTHSQKSYLLSTPMGKWLTPSWHSFLKLYNLIHVPYWFLPSKIPTYYIGISTKNLEKLRGGLPFDQNTLSYGDMLEKNKNFANATIVSPSDHYAGDIKIRYRGRIQNNWAAEKKALRLKFPATDLFSGNGSLNLLLPIDRNYFSVFLNMYRAQKFGLFTTNIKFVRVIMNQRDFGVYLASEPWSRQLLARGKSIDTNNIFSSGDEPFSDNASLFNSSGKSHWKSYTATDKTGSFEELDTLVNLVENASDKEFSEKIGVLFDLEKFYRWQIINTLAGSTHQGDTGNTVLIFRQENGKFEYIPWDVGLYQADENFYNINSTLAKRILSDKKFFGEYNKLLGEYVSDENNLLDDLRYYDSLYQKYRIEFYKDQAKIDNDYKFDKRIAWNRRLIESNFENAKKLAVLKDFPSTVSVKNTRTLKFEGSFERFNEIFLSVDRFIANNDQFTKGAGNTIVILPGVHVFMRDVIIPRNSRLIIKPGAKLLFSPKTSLISYSPISAVGNADAMIVIAALYPGGDPWGSFGVVNSTKNYFNFIRVSGGSTALVNGIPFTSQFSMQNSDSEIYHSIFKDGRSDDGVHAVWGSVVIRDSIFQNNSSDGLDLDAVKNSKISGNKFYNDDVSKSAIDGDGIDISGTENVEVSGNQITNFGDKCISVGEGAEIFLRSNILAMCNYGIAVKDGSLAKIDRNIIVGNMIAGLALYRKKQDWILGGRAEVFDSILWGNAAEISIDEIVSYPTKTGDWKNVVKPGLFSSLSIAGSTIEGGFEGVDIIDSRPDFESILPASVYNLVKDKLD